MACAIDSPKPTPPVPRVRDGSLQREHPLDEARHPIDVTVHCAHHLGQGGSIAWATERQTNLCLEHTQWRAQFVRDVANELPFMLEGCLQTV